MNNLYNADYYVWTQRQVKLLRTQHFAQLDVEYLVAEILGLARYQRKELKRHIRKLLHYFLKSQLYPERVSGRWLGKLCGHRDWIEKLIVEMPSMAPLLDGYIADAYADIADRLTSKANLPRSSFPETLACTREQLLTQDFMPWTSKNEKAADS
ncbi:DUF29 domain-containing protein [Duganella radicis]|uniref:DUF29 family protein n=1 Tax=Duganella radicis TaxID=551988 RepID=A0A6L6PJM7_9BURK|nr:DUF29 domain-containing protein [Duganella radicis]MTV39250.1 DUF29 family protein [Duganella radicis]